MDEHLFRQEMGDVAPLRASARSDSKAPRTSKRKLGQEIATDRPVLPRLAGSTHGDADDASTHRKNGVQNRIMQRLKRGQFPLGDQLDLHHMTTETGHIALLEFIAGAQNAKLQCVRIIHGKGLRSVNGPRLKLMAWQVLRDHPQVLAFSTCKPSDGGSGAVDVLLKSS